MSFRNRKEANPFRILGAAAQDSRSVLIQKQEELALFENQEKTEQALAALLNPQTRMEAEIRWFPMMTASEIQRLLAFLDQHYDNPVMPDPPVPSLVAQFHLLRLVLGSLRLRTPEEAEAVLYSLATVADTLLPGQVMEELNVDHRKAGFPEISNLYEVERSTRELFRETVKDFRARTSAVISQAQWNEVSGRFRMEYQDASSPWHNSSFLKIASDLLEQEL